MQVQEFKGEMKRQPITEPDRTNTSESYWNMVLESHGLGCSRGDSPRIRVKQPNGEVSKERLVELVGGYNNIAGIDEQVYREETGKKS